MPKMREVALEQKVNQLNAIVCQQADRIAELERMLKHDRLEIICYENDVDSRDALIRDMWLHSYCSIAKTREDDEHHIESVIERMRELGIEVD